MSCIRRLMISRATSPSPLAALVPTKWKISRSLSDVGKSSVSPGCWERVPYLLFGADLSAAGTLEIDGRAFLLQDFRPTRAMAAGFALLPANRLRDGGLPTATVTENLTLPTVGAYFTGGILRRRREL